ncbi:GDNF-inducible zinc finger protein 1-like [Bolinopsis microptera]|uniref:GDNF-inducible zinc finger protein 1-like n=1 Tax=Bolinopsis microptera TaxID=2820187 RepID=UPI00307A1297
MDCLEYSDANELFSELVNDISGACAIGRDVQVQQQPVQETTTANTNGDSDAWVSVFVPVASLQKHITKANQVDVSEDEVIREASREKVLEMYGTSKIEAIPLSNQTDGRDPVQEQNGTEPSLLPQDSEPSSGRLFLPPTLKRSERHANPAFRCPECLAGFTRADNLKRHFKILHEGSEAYVCPHCNKSFARKNTLQRHVASQHTREKKYGCDYCDKTFIYSFEVPVHVQNVHSDTKGYACTMCDTKFKWPRSLERHCLAVHEGFKFKCTECDTLLGSLDAYKKHGARFHPTMIFANKEAPLTRDGAITNSKDSHICQYCHSVFAIKANLERHIEKIHFNHTGDILECEWCSNKFRSRDTYQRHVKKFHVAQTMDVMAMDSRTMLGSYHVNNSEMTEISLTELLSHTGNDSDPLPFPGDIQSCDI